QKLDDVDELKGEDAGDHGTRRGRDLGIAGEESDDSGLAVNQTMALALAIAPMISQTRIALPSPLSRVLGTGLPSGALSTPKQTMARTAGKTVAMRAMACDSALSTGEDNTRMKRSAVAAAQPS